MEILSLGQEFVENDRSPEAFAAFLSDNQLLRQIQWGGKEYRTEHDPKYGPLEAETRHGVLETDHWGKLTFWYFDLGGQRQANSRTKWFDVVMPNADIKFHLDIDGPNAGTWLAYRENKPGIIIED